MTKLRHLPIVLGAVLAAMCAGCGSGPSKGGAGATTELNAAAMEMNVTRARTDAALRSLGELMSADSSALHPQYDAFSSAVEGVTESAKRTDARASAMKKQGQGYFKKWDAESAKVKGENPKKRSPERKAAVQEEFQRITTLYQDARARFKAFHSGLRDLQQTLDHELTIYRVASVRDVAARAQTEGLELQSTIDTLMAELGNLGAPITSAPMDAAGR